jgi:hypothetical protein
LAAAPVTVKAPEPVLLPDVLPADGDAAALGPVPPAPAPPAPALGVPIAAGGELTPLVLCVLNVSSRTRPATVLTIARMTRRIGGALLS